jgi:predicted unusual protein kinase regulating ubiquinone biosynthesis (AarF/ABC1/UbiB family)
MMSKDPAQLSRFLDELRQETKSGPGRGLRRLAKLARGSVGLASSMLKGSERGADIRLDASELARFESLVRRLGELKGLPMKFGQVISYLELELPDDVRQLLSLLQTQSPATPFDQITQVLREDLGSRAPQLLQGIDSDPVSVASIGQVHRAELPDCGAVAVKVRHPGIEAALRSDFRAAAWGTGFASAIVPGMGATARDFVAEMRARLLEECDYALEAKRQQLFASFYARHPVIVVPEVMPHWCGPRVLTTRWWPGRSFETFCEQATQEERDRAGEALFEFYLGTLYRQGTFHADPHPGNYHFSDDGRIIVFDYGCVRVFEPQLVGAFVALADAVRSDDRSRMMSALRDMGASPSSNDAAFRHLRGLLRAFFAPLLVTGPHPIEGRIVINVKQVMRDKLAIAKLRLPGRFMFLMRIRFGLYAVLSRLGSVCEWARIEQRFAEEAQTDPRRQRHSGAPRPG